MAGAWLMLSVGDERQHGGNDGYADDPSCSYRWDDTVPNHGRVSVGDAIVLWDKKRLIGASIIERITETDAEKNVYRCANCGKAHIKQRKTLSPAYRCFNCFTNFDVPVIERQPVHEYASDHAAGWVDLYGVLDGSELRALCESPKSQLSLRPLRWADFKAAVAMTAGDSALDLLEAREAQSVGGHTRATVRVRLGQAAFRRRLLDEYGAVCAVTGPAPEEALEAGHLYSYAELGVHHECGGLLFRRDVHRLFDLGRLAIDPEGLTVDVDPDLWAYPQYQGLHGEPLRASLNDRHRRWLAQHWREHRRPVESG